ncbi:MAG: hypothetical protein QM749_17080 [Aquabacterium sp.]
MSALLAEQLGKQGLSLAQLVQNRSTDTVGGFNSLLYQLSHDSKLAKVASGFTDILTGSNDLGLGVGGCTRRKRATTA